MPGDHAGLQPLALLWPLPACGLPAGDVARCGGQRDGEQGAHACLHAASAAAAAAERGCLLVAVPSSIPCVGLASCICRRPAQLVALPLLPSYSGGGSRAARQRAAARGQVRRTGWAAAAAAGLGVRGRQVTGGCAAADRRPLSSTTGHIVKVNQPTSTSRLLLLPYFAGAGNSSCPHRTLKQAAAAAAAAVASQIRQQPSLALAAAVRHHWRRCAALSRLRGGRCRRSRQLRRRAIAWLPANSRS